MISKGHTPSTWKRTGTAEVEIRSGIPGTIFALRLQLLASQAPCLAAKVLQEDLEDLGFRYTVTGPHSCSLTTTFSGRSLKKRNKHRHKPDALWKKMMYKSWSWEKDGFYQWLMSRLGEGALAIRQLPTWV